MGGVIAYYPPTTDRPTLAQHSSPPPPISDTSLPVTSNAHMAITH